MTFFDPFDADYPRAAPESTDEAELAALVADPDPEVEIDDDGYDWVAS